jgi:hypothetical protein
MTETPSDNDKSEIDREDATDGAVDPREGGPPPAERDPERRAKPAPLEQIDRPGPLNPGEEDRDLPSGVESYERPGRDGNWADRRD